MYLLLDEEIKKLIFKESQIVPCHKLTPRQERIYNEQCLLQFIMNRREGKWAGVIAMKVDKHYHTE